MPLAQAEETRGSLLLTSSGKLEFSARMEAPASRHRAQSPHCLSSKPDRKPRALRLRGMYWNGLDPRAIFVKELLLLDFSLFCCF